METVESIQWLRESNLYGIAEKISPVLKKIYLSCLGVSDEKVLIIGDKGANGRELAGILAGSYYLAANSLNLNAKLVIQDAKQRGSSADNDIKASIMDLKENSVIFVNASERLGSITEMGKSFRKFCIKKKFRFVSSPGLGSLGNNQIDALVSAININYNQLQAKNEEIKRVIDGAKMLHITTDKGTDLYFDVNGVSPQCSDGDYTNAGTGGNLPAGEIHMYPNGKGVDGKVVIDGSSKMYNGTILIKKPITLTIEKGSITSVQGGDEAKLLEKSLDWAAQKSKFPNSVRRIGEFGFGLNANASIIGATVIDEKALGSAHIGIGSNYWFGGSIYSIIHLDQIFRNPKIFADDVLLKM